MIYRVFLVAQLIFSGLYLYKNVLTDGKQVLSAQTNKDDEQDRPMTFRPEITTTTAFGQKVTEEYEEAPYNTVYVDDEELEYGTEEIKQPGRAGLITYRYLATFWLDEIIDRRMLEKKEEASQDEVVARGKKVVWKTLDTPEYGEIRYWAKMRVWATKYDSTCEGCNNTTALGAPVQQGVCAVDPKVIDMYTHFYVPGYGRCQALDVGGAIKGNKIDLAYEDHTKGSWRTGYTDIYLMDNVPQ